MCFPNVCSVPPGTKTDTHSRRLQMPLTRCTWCPHKRQAPDRLINNGWRRRAAPSGGSGHPAEQLHEATLLTGKPNRVVSAKKKNKTITTSVLLLNIFKNGVEWVSRFPHEDLFIIVVIKVATNYVKSFNFLDRSNHLETIIQKYEWRATFYLESGLLQLHGAIKCNTSEPKGLGAGMGVGRGQPCAQNCTLLLGMTEFAGRRQWRDLVFHLWFLCTGYNSPITF